MKLNKLAAMLIAASICLPSFALADSVAIVNGTPIEKQDVDQAVTFLVSRSNGQTADTPALREDVKNRLINRELILQEAKRRGLGKNPAVQRQITQATQDILQDALVADILKQKPITDAQIKARYDQVAAKFKGTQEIHALQITLKSEADAQKIIADLQKGARFEQLAKSKSIDPNAKVNGGDMGYGNLSTMNPALADVLKTLKAGQISQKPFQSNVGWHVFKVLDVRPAKFESLDAAKGQIARELQNEEISQEVAALRSKAKIQ